MGRPAERRARDAGPTLTAIRRAASEAADRASPADAFSFAPPTARLPRSLPVRGEYRIGVGLPDPAWPRSALGAGADRAIGNAHAHALASSVDARGLTTRARRYDVGDAVPAALRREPAMPSRDARAAQSARTAVARFRSWLVAEGWHEIEVDAAMRVRHATRFGLGLLGTIVAAAPLRTGQTLPAGIASWLRRMGSAAPAGATRTVVCGCRQVILRGLPAIDDDGWLLYVGERGVVVAPRVPDTLPDVPGLSPREREVLVWVAAGKTDAQAAAILGISVRTVQKHLENVYVKLGVEGRTAAVMRARIAAGSR